MGSFLCDACDNAAILSPQDYGCVNYIPNFEPYRFFFIPCAWFTQNPAVVAPPAAYLPWDNTLPLTAKEEEKKDFLEELVSENRIIILQPSADPVSVSPTTTTIPAIGCNNEETITTGESFTFTQQWDAAYDTTPFADLNADWQTDAETGTQAQTAMYAILNQLRTHAVGYVDCSGNLYIAHKDAIVATFEEAINYARVEVTRINPGNSVPNLVTKYQVSVNMGKTQFLTSAKMRAWTNLETLGSTALNAAFA